MDSLHQNRNIQQRVYTRPPISPSQNKRNSPTQSKKKQTLLGIIILIIIGVGSSYFYIQYFQQKNVLGDIDKRQERPLAPIIRAEDLRQKQLNHENFTLLDVRAKQEFDKEHIEGSINLPQKEISERYTELFPLEREIITICAGDECKLSTRSSTELLELGFTNVLNCDDGIIGWKILGYPLVGNNIENSQKTDQDILSKMDAFVSSKVVQQQKDAGHSVFIIDLRSQSDFQEGHIPGARLIQTEEFEQALRDLERLQDIVIYDLDGEQSENAFIDIQLLDFQNVKILTGGFRAWQNSGFEIEK